MVGDWSHMSPVLTVEYEVGVILPNLSGLMRTELAG